jgi:nitrogen regulatory protein P-II 1
MSGRIQRECFSPRLFDPLIFEKCPAVPRANTAGWKDTALSAGNITQTGLPWWRYATISKRPDRNTIHEGSCLEAEMKMVQAIIRPERFEDVKHSLEDEDLVPMTCTTVTGRGEQMGISLEYRGKNVQVDMLPKLLMEIVGRDEDLDKIIATIRDAGRTGKNGDGKIFVLPVDRMIRIRTGEEWD